jgi:hypothetical protein
MRYLILDNDFALSEMSLAEYVPDARVYERITGLETFDQKNGAVSVCNTDICKSDLGADPTEIGMTKRIVRRDRKVGPGCF